MLAARQCPKGSRPGGALETSPKAGQQPYEPLVRHKDVVDPAKLDVDLEAEVGKGLRGGFHHVLDLDALRGHSQEGVPNTLHLGCRQRKHVNRQAMSKASLSLKNGRKWEGRARAKSFSSPCLPLPQTHRTPVFSPAG